MEPIRLPTQFTRHLVERIAEMPDIPFLFENRNLNVIISCSNLISCENHAANRGYQPIGKGQPNPDSRQEKNERNESVHTRECDLDT